MDNILKMLLGVLSVAGVIALVIPDTNPISDTSVQTSTEAAAPPPSISTSLPAQQPPQQFNSGSVSDFQIGAPTIDGRPLQPDFGMPFGASPQMTPSQGDNAQSSEGGYTPPPYVMPGSTSLPEGGQQPGPMPTPVE
ncbi:hypothetical protein [Sphingorhabdus sp.]|uniref:hypothetical protein n=1 Tax=Sphingorhabdus sp. TaxID=1902408 RepID=UPI00391C10B8